MNFFIKSYVILNDKFKKLVRLKSRVMGSKIDSRLRSNLTSAARAFNWDLCYESKSGSRYRNSVKYYVITSASMSGRGSKIKSWSRSRRQHT